MNKYSVDHRRLVLFYLSLVLVSVQQLLLLFFTLKVLERVIENCGARAADREKWSRVQRLRENAKHLFLYVIEDKNIARMMDTHTIDQIIKHILTQVSENDDNDNAIDQKS